MIDGIDVSNHQGVIDWPKVKASGSRFAYLKATEGVSFVDPFYGRNRDACHRLGLYHGAYHFARPLADPIASARAFADVAGVSRDQLPPCLDIEVRDGASDAHITGWIRTWLGAARSLFDRTPVVYTSPGFWSALGSPSVPALLWIAHWKVAAPSIPRTFTAEGSGYTFWQWTSDGSVPGVAGRCDRNRFAGSAVQLRALSEGRLVLDVIGDEAAKLPHGDTLRLDVAGHPDSPWAGWRECIGPMLWIDRHGLQPAATGEGRHWIAWRGESWYGARDVTNVVRRLLANYKLGE